MEGSLGLGRAGAGARPRERGRESETSRTRSATEVGDEPLRATRRGTEGCAQPHPRQRDELHRQLPKLLRARHAPRENQTTRNGCERARTRPSEETKLRLRAMDWFSERAQNGHSVPVESPTGDPNDRGVGNVLSEEGGKVWAVVGQFSLEPGLRAVRACLLCVRRADRDVRGGIRIAKGVGGPEVCAWDEARKLGLSCVVTGLRSGVNECGDRVVAAVWPCPGRNWWRGCPESWSGKQHRVFGRWAMAHLKRKRTEALSSPPSALSHPTVNGLPSRSVRKTSDTHRCFLNMLDLCTGDRPHTPTHPHTTTRQHTYTTQAHRTTHALQISTFSNLCSWRCTMNC